MRKIKNSKKNTNDVGTIWDVVQFVIHTVAAVSYIISAINSK